MEGIGLNTQTYKNHARSVPGFHFFLVPLCFVTIIAAITYTVFSILRGEGVFAPLLIVTLALIVTLTVFFLRSFVCKVQDRAIRAEENLRHYVLTGKLLDSRLSIRQIIALRFASDDEFSILCEKAVQEGLMPDDIKRAIKNWQADHDRV